MSVGKNIFIHFKPFLLFKLEKIFKERRFLREL